MCYGVPWLPKGAAAQLAYVKFRFETNETYCCYEISIHIHTYIHVYTYTIQIYVYFIRERVYFAYVFVREIDQIRLWHSNRVRSSIRVQIGIDSIKTGKNSKPRLTRIFFQYLNFNLIEAGDSILKMWRVVAKCLRKVAVLQKVALIESRNNFVGEMRSKSFNCTPRFRD